MTRAGVEIDAQRATSNDRVIIRWAIREASEPRIESNLLVGKVSHGVEPSEAQKSVVDLKLLGFTHRCAKRRRPSSQRLTRRYSPNATRPHRT